MPQLGRRLKAYTTANPNLSWWVDGVFFLFSAVWVVIFIYYLSHPGNGPYSGPGWAEGTQEEGGIGILQIVGNVVAVGAYGIFPVILCILAFLRLMSKLRKIRQK